MKPLSHHALFLAASAAALASCARHGGQGIPAASLGPLPLFESRQELDVGSTGHTDFDLADFDGDGRLDLAVLSSAGELAVLANNGTSFVPVRSMQVGGLPLSLTRGDFNGDGAPDYAMARWQAGEVTVALNTGSGDFAAPQQLPCVAALATATADLDGDGDLDLLASRDESPLLSYWLGNGSGGFVAQPDLVLPGGGSVFQLAVGDVTHDGHPDVVLCDRAAPRVVILHGGLGMAPGVAGSTEVTLPNLAIAAAVGDVSGDNLPDLVLPLAANQSFLVVSAVLPGIVTQELNIGQDPGLCDLADVNADGRLDLVASLPRDASVVVGLQQVGGGIADWRHYDMRGVPTRVRIGDFNQDGAADLFGASLYGDRIAVFRGGSNGAMQASRNFAVGLQKASWVASGDFDGNGSHEVLVASEDNTRVNVMQANQDGTLSIAGGMEVGNFVYSITAADLDGDGKLDVVCSLENGVRILRNTSTPGAFSFALLPSGTGFFTSATRPVGSAVVDLDQDGALDLAVCDYLAGTLHVLPGTSVPFAFGPELLLTVGGGPFALAAADFTGDGRSDLAVSRSAWGDVLVLRNAGAMNLVEFVAVPVGGDPNYLLTADYNQDDRADLVVSNAASGTVSVLFGTSTGFVGESHPAGETPTALLAQDLNGDGTADILVTNLNGQSFRVMIGDGLGGFPGSTVFPGTYGASDAVLLDVNGDSLQDLVIASLVTDRVSVIRRLPD